MFIKLYVLYLFLKTVFSLTDFFLSSSQDDGSSFQISDKRHSKFNRIFAESFFSRAKEMRNDLAINFLYLSV